MGATVDDGREQRLQDLGGGECLALGTFRPVDDAKYAANSRWSFLGAGRFRMPAVVVYGGHYS